MRSRDDDARIAVAYRSRVGTNSLAVDTPTQAPNPPPLTWSWLPTPWRDVVLAFIVAVIQVGGSFGAATNQTDRNPMDALAVVLLLVGPVAVAVRRRYPVAALIASTLIAHVFVGLGYPYGPVFLSLIVTLFSAVLLGRRRAAWIVAGAALAVVPVHSRVFDGTEPASAGGMAAIAAWLAVVMVTADVVRVTRERAAEAAHARTEESRRHASDERLRLARELHDVLAHNISLINVRAGVALHLIDEKPDEVRAALEAIKDASKETLRETRSILGVLRQVDEDAPRAPAPSLARLDDLVSRSMAAGLSVTVEVDGKARPLPAGTDLAGYRIVQEALTNVTRHSQATRARVRVAYRDNEIVVDIDDDGPSASTPSTVGTGSGVAGMRERAAAIGGELMAGPRPDGGFRVTARLPLEDGE